MKPFRGLNPGVPSEKAGGLCALAVMTKVPQAGQVKTRLVPPLTPNEAAELNKCFLRDTTAAISQICNCRPVGGAEEAGTNGCGVAVYTPVGAESAYVHILPAAFVLLPHRGESFGVR